MMNIFQQRTFPNLRCNDYAYMVELQCKYAAITVTLSLTTTFHVQVYAMQCCILHNAEFEHLLKGSNVSTEDDYMIPGESTQLSSRSLASEISAQMEGATLTKTQYRSIRMLISSLLGLPTGALTYAGHTLQPLTLYWHCSAFEIGEFSPEYSIGLFSEMAQEGINKVNVGLELYSVIPCRNVSNSFVYPRNFCRAYVSS